VYGIHLFESDYNDISNNNITNNNYGIHISVSDHNNVYYNNFINNTQNAYDDFSNKWDKGYPSGGNYWADYIGVDTDGDGIGDTPYIVAGGSNKDNYPLMYIWNGSLPANVYVDNDYDETTNGWGLNRFNKIQYAIYKVQENGTIFVFNGTYYENILLNKRLNLLGENKDTTIIDGNNSGDVVYVSEKSVNISRFTIRNSGNNNFYPYWDAGVEIHSNNNIISDNNIILNNNFGIYLKDSSNNTMLNNNASNNSNNGIYIEHYTPNKNHTLINNTANDNGWDGIFVSGTNNTLINNTANNNYNRGIYVGGNNNTVFANTVKNNQDNGITVGEFSDIISNNIYNNYGTGISIYGSSNKIYSNHIYNNTYYGIRIDNGEKNNISYNNITSNYHGIELIQSSENNTISNNIINSNQWIGINIYQCNNNVVLENNVSYNDYGIALWSPSSNNTIYNNYFNNTDNAYDTGNNTWNVTKTSGTNIIGGSYLGGNFWSDYFGFDIDGDGLGDTDLPYDCEEKIQNGGDWLPLTFRQDEFPPEIVDNTLSKCYTGDSFTFNVSVFDNAFVSTVCIEYWYGSENHTNVSMNNVGGDFWEKTILIQNTLDILHYVIAANDTSNNWNNTDVKDITIYDNDKPVIIDYTPDNPEAGDPFSFNATVTDNIQVSGVWIEYWYDEGEHNNESMTNTAEDIWEKTIIIGDIYEILHYFISAVDTSDNWINTDIKDLPIISNDPPNPPTIIGPNSGKPGTSYDFIFNSIDPNGDNVRFIIDWGDTTSNTTDFVSSGTDIEISHTWSLQGTYTITAKAEDSEGLIGLETTKTITIPRAKPKNFNFILFNWLFKHFPMLEKLLTLIRTG
jgi:parallel beta-helix repeat protein